MAKVTGLRLRPSTSYTYQSRPLEVTYWLGRYAIYGSHRAAAIVITANATLFIRSRQDCFVGNILLAAKYQERIMLMGAPSMNTTTIIQITLSPVPISVTFYPVLPRKGASSFSPESGIIGISNHCSCAINPFPVLLAEKPRI
jgi:hypothetical protein